MKKNSRCNIKYCMKKKNFRTEYCSFHYLQRNYDAMLKHQFTGCGGGKQSPKYNADNQE